jgi:hypothetical protein
MGGALTAPTTQGSPPNDFPDHWRPPKRSPDDGYARNGDLGVTRGDPAISLQTKDEFPHDSGNQMKMGSSEIFGFFAGGDTTSGLAADGNSRGVFAEGGRKGIRGGVKSRTQGKQGLGWLEKWNIMPQFFFPKATLHIRSNWSIFLGP